MNLTYDRLLASRKAHQRYIQSRDEKVTGNGWADTLKSAIATKQRLEVEGIDKEDTDILINIINEIMNTPHKRHIEGVSALFRFSPFLKEDVYENIDEWLSNASISNISISQALINIDAYQVTPLKRITCYLYIMQLEEDDVIDLMKDTLSEQSIERLRLMHPEYIKTKNKTSDNEGYVHTSLQAIF